MNQRIMIILGVFFLGLVFICGSLFSLYTPVWQELLATVQLERTQVAAINQATAMALTRSAEQAATQAAQTRTAEIIARETAQASATAEAIVATAQAATAMAATLTAMPTPTLTPTSTPTSTPPPQANVCQAAVSGTDRLVFSVPGGGRRVDAQLLPVGTAIALTGRLKDMGWYQASYQEESVWIRSDFVVFADNGCQLVIYDLSYLLGELEQGEQLILDETFATNENRWVNSSGALLIPSRTSYGDARIRIEANTIDPQVIGVNNNSKLEDLSAVKVVTSFERSNFTSEGYVGLRLRGNDGNYYAVRVRSNCRVDVYETEVLVSRTELSPGENGCGDDAEDFLAITLDTNYQLEIRLNDADSLRVTLADPEGKYIRGEVQFEVSNVIAEISYVVITVPGD